MESTEPVVVLSPSAHPAAEPESLLEAADAHLGTVEASRKASSESTQQQLSALTASPGTRLEALKDSVLHSEIVVKATEALTEVVDKLSHNATVASARATLSDSVSHLRAYSEATLKALPEQKVVKQALEALDRALRTLSHLKDVLVDEGESVAGTVTASIATARAVAHDAVVQAKTYVQSVSDKVAERATRLTEEAHARAVAAARKAGELDSKYHVKDRAVEIAEKWHVPEYAAAAEAKVKALNDQYKVQDRVKVVLTHASDMDAKYTSGRGTALFTWGLAQATRSLAYAQSLLEEYKGSAASYDMPPPELPQLPTTPATTAVKSH